MCNNDHFGVEVVIVLELLKGRAFEQAARVKHVAAVKLGHLRSEDDVLQKRKNTVRDVAGIRHAATKRSATDHPRTLDDLRFSLEDRLHEIEHEFRRVLAVRMHDGEYASAQIEPSLETGLLGSSVASVDLMMDDIKPGPSVLESFRHLTGLVGTLVIDNDGNSIVPERFWNARKHGRQGLFSAVGGDHNGLLHRGSSPSNRCCAFGLPNPNLLIGPRHCSTCSRSAAVSVKYLRRMSGSNCGIVPIECRGGVGFRGKFHSDFQVRQRASVPHSYRR